MAQASPSYSRLTLLLGGACFLFCFMFSPGRFYTVDSVSAAETTRAMLHGRLDIAKNEISIEGRGGLHYSRHELPWSIVLIPFDLASIAVEHALPDRVEELVFTHGPVTVILPLANQLITALLIVVLLRFLLALGVSVRAAVIVAASAVGATLLLPYSRDLFRQPLAALLMLLATAALWDLREGREQHRAWQAGLLVALVVANRYASLVTLPVFLVGFAARVIALPIPRKWSRLAPAFLGPIVIGVLFHFGSIWLRWGHPFANIGYEENFPSNLFKSVVRYALSPEGGMIGYGSLSVFLVWGLPALWRRDRWLTSTIVGLSATLIVVHGKYVHYWGGVNPGPRYLLPLLPLWFLALGALAEREKAQRGFWIAWGAVASVGFAFNLLESLVDYARAPSAGMLTSRRLPPFLDDGQGPWSVAFVGANWWGTIISMRETRWPALVALAVVGALTATAAITAWRESGRLETQAQ